MSIELVTPSHGLPISLLIESIGYDKKGDFHVTSRDSLTRHHFECVTEKGYKFTTMMLGFNREHAYRRLRAQTDGSILVSM